MIVCKILIVCYFSLPLVVLACQPGQYVFLSIFCLSCNSRCQTCTGGTESNCQTCKASNNRQIQTTSHTCICKDGYGQYSTPQDNCKLLTCTNNCLTCRNSQSFCTSCDSSNVRVLTGSNTCVCDSKYYDSGASLCSSCHYSCKECSTSGSTHCTSCNTLNFRNVLQSGACSCKDKYYDSGTDQKCQLCNYKCKTCSTSSTNCLTCGTNRLTSPSCLCKDGYYEDGSSETCPACQYSCKTCTTSASCASCDAATAFRGLATSTPYCACLDRYFDANTLVCSTCHPTCLQCTGSNLNTACTACSSAANRQLSGTTCVCKARYYQTNANTELCSLCNYRCKTCVTSPTNCQSCDSSLYRTLAGATCPCLDGYYQSTVTGLCTLCQSSCKTCTNGTQCVTCDTTAKLYSLNSSNLCSCVNTNYFNTTQGKCLACDVKCATCDQSSGTLCLSCDSSRYLLSNACPCLPYHFDNGVSVCPSCHYSCQTCNGLTLSNCLTCNTANLRGPLTSGKCSCQALYFDDGTVLCKSCDYKCATCLSAATCATCDSAKNRATPASICPCKTGYFQNSTLNCQKCAYYCVTCSDAITCLTCNPPNRALDSVTLKCTCPDKYYDDGSTITCKACLGECKTCTNSTKCVSCQISLFRSLDGTNRCPCITKYYDLSGTCTACLVQCATCTAGTTCASCNSGSNREMVSSKCPCKTGYYSTGVQLCGQCDYTCKNCLTTSSYCTSCDTTRTLNSNVCQCNAKYYDNGITSACSNCQYTCATCSTAVKCSSCSSAKYRTFDASNNLCICLDKYYDDTASNQLCLPCSYKCKTCTNSTKCLTCDATKFRITPDSLCPCADKYYDSATNSQTCLPCHYSCSTCSKASQCLTCQTSTNHRVVDSVTKKCKCSDGFYDDGANQLCLPCDYTCTTCSGSASNCLSCSDSTTYRNLITSSCPCQDRYFEKDLNLVCEKCQYTCKTCLEATTCKSCDASRFREYIDSDSLCHCKTGYYDDSTNKQICKQCHLSCLTCLDNLKCETCDSTYNRVLNSSAMYDGSTSPFCICKYSFYSIGGDLTCYPCHYSCDVCSDSQSSDCLYCDASANRLLTGQGSCACKDGFYEDSRNQLCPACHSYCATCIGPLNSDCNTCVKSKYYLLAQTSCFLTCPETYFDNKAQMICSACNSNCLHCLDEKVCTQCASKYYLWKNDNTCYIKCPDGYWEDKTDKLCHACPTGCKTCVSNIKCNDCFAHYYFDSAVNLCFSCHQYCNLCFGPGQDQCLTCQQSLFFKSNKCLNLTCPYGQYVDSVQGCKNCIEAFSNSLTCSKSQALLCMDSFKLKNGLCKICSQVDGYHITTQTKTCSEICGDGKLFDYQCDDGNQLNGDGCSKNCMIENGWKCTSTGVGTVSTCTLQAALSLSLDSIYKFSGMNKVILYFILSLPYRMADNLNILVADTLPMDFKWSFHQTQQNLSSISLTIQYNTNLQGKSIQISYGSSKRLLLQDLTNLSSKSSGYESKRMLTASSISFGTQIQLSTFPPVLYYSQSDFSFYETSKKVIYYLAIILLVVSLLVVPKKTHLHSFTFSHIIAKVWLIFGLALESKLDWVNFVLRDIKQFGLIGGISMGKCCSEMSSFYGYSSELVSNSLWVLIAFALGWIIIGTIYFINAFVSKIQRAMEYINYFSVTLHLALSYHIIYSGLNSLYHYSIQNTLDALNTTLGISITLCWLLFMIVLWMMTSWIEMDQNQSESQKIKSTQNSRDSSSINEQPAMRSRIYHKDIEVEQVQIDNQQGENHPSKNLQFNFIFQNLTQHKNIFDKSKNRQVDTNSKHNQILTQSDRSSEKHKDKSHSQQSKRQEEITQLTGCTQVSELQQIQQNAKTLSKQFLKWDYRDLYSTKNPNSKYFMPLTVTFLYLQIVLLVFLSPYDLFYFVIIEGALQLIYCAYLLLSRPFRSQFTNFRIILVEIIFLAMFSVVAYYLYLSKRNQFFKLGETIFIYLCQIMFAVCIGCCILEHINSWQWKQKILDFLEPCFMAFRLRGIKKIYDIKQNEMQKQYRQQISVHALRQNDSAVTGTQFQAFYMRMLKKQAVNKKYRKQRKLKQDIYKPY